MEIAISIYYFILGVSVVYFMDKAIPGTGIITKIVTVIFWPSVLPIVAVGNSLIVRG